MNYLGRKETKRSSKINYRLTTTILKKTSSPFPIEIWEVVQGKKRPEMLLPSYYQESHGKRS